MTRGPDRVIIHILVIAYIKIYADTFAFYL